MSNEINPKTHPAQSPMFAGSIGKHEHDVPHNRGAVAFYRRPTGSAPIESAPPREKKVPDTFVPAPPQRTRGPAYPPPDQCEASLAHLRETNAGLESKLVEAVKTQESPSAIEQYCSGLAEVTSHRKNDVFHFACAAVGLLRQKVLTLNKQGRSEGYSQNSPWTTNFFKTLAHHEFREIKNGLDFDIVGDWSRVVSAAEACDKKALENDTGVVSG